MKYCYACQENLADSKDDNRYCESCYQFGKEEDDSHLVEYYKDKFMIVGGKEYPSVKVNGNTQLCSECKRPIYEVPLLLWSEDGTLMLAFCIECVEKLNFLPVAGHA